MTVSDINTKSAASPPTAAPTLPTFSPCPPTPERTPEQCPPPAPATTPDPTTSSRLECLGSNPDYDTFVAVNTVDLMNAELNKNEIALNDYFIIKPPLLRTLHDSDPCRMIMIMIND